MSYFDDTEPDQDIDVSALKKRKPKSTKSELKAVSEDQGWVDKTPKKPGPKRREPRAVLTMNGPARVIDQFREYADNEEISQWKALENLMEKAGLLK